MKRTILGVLLLTIALLLPANARAQSGTTGAIGGTVRDATGAVLPGVTVEVSSPALIEKVRIATTDGQGNYKVVDLRPGTYSVTFTLPGFSTFTHEGIELTVGFTATANAELKLGALEETVTVTGASPVVDVQNVRTQTVLASEVLDTLPVPKTASGFITLTLGASAQQAQGGAPLVDIGGSKGDAASSVAIHGMRNNDQRYTYDGMNANITILGGGRRSFVLNQVAVQENVIATGNASAEVETGGMVLNAVPKDGGNTFTVYFLGTYTNGSFQATNIDDTLRSQGITQGQQVKRIYDWGVGLGGPIVKDKVWFYSANRWWGSQEYQPGAYFNRSADPFVYVRDLSRQAYSDQHAWDIGLRVTWRAAAMHKITISDNAQRNCFCYLGIGSLLSPESARLADFKGLHFVMATWSHTASNRLLFDAGLSYGHFPVSGRVEGTNIGIYNPGNAALGLPLRYSGYVGVNVANGLPGNCRQGCPDGDTRLNPLNQRFSMSYVVGSHAFKVGEQLLEGFERLDQFVPPSAINYGFQGANPFRIYQFAYPVVAKVRTQSLGLYAQDQWTIKRLTLNLGVRYDRFTGWNPAGTRAATRFTPAFDFSKVDDVPDFNDVSPRLGAAYDVFGNGKTAIKGSIGRYLFGLGAETGEANHPALAVAESVFRSWSDANRNLVPDCELTNPRANGECGQINNLQFGQPFRNTFYDPSVLTGWGKRGYSWQGSVSIQHELWSGIAVNVGYFRTSYGHQTATQNTAVTAASFDQFCVTSPISGQPICGLYDAKPAAFGQVRNLVTNVGQFGTQTETFDGMDIGLNARFGPGALLTGGVSIGRQVLDYCFQNDRPDLTAFNFTTSAVFTDPRTSAYCRIAQPWSTGTQFKVNGVYPLKWGIEPSFTYQNLAGASVSAAYAVPNANAIALPQIGRALTNANPVVNLIPPGQQYLDRLNLLDLRVAKVVRVGRARMKGMVDLYNLFNINTVLTVSGRYPTHLRPTSIVGGRLVKLGIQLDF